MFEWYREKRISCEKHHGIEISYIWNNLDNNDCPLCIAYKELDKLKEDWRILHLGISKENIQKYLGKYSKESEVKYGNI